METSGRDIGVFIGHFRQLRATYQCFATMVYIGFARVFAHSLFHVERHMVVQGFGSAQS